RWMERLRSRFDTEAKQARDALRRSEANFRNFFENSPVPMYLADRETGEFVDVNRAMLDTYGYSRTEFLEMTIYDIRPPEDVPKLKTHIKRMGPTPEIYSAGEWRHRAKNGRIMAVEISVSGLVMDNRALYLTAVHDISPRKLAEAATERRARELQQLAASSLLIAGTQTIEALIDVAAERARQLVGAHLAIARCSPDLVKASVSEKYTGRSRIGDLADTEAVWQVLVRKRYPQRLTAAEVRAHPDYPKFAARHSPALDIGAVLAVPLMRSDSELLGALLVADKGGSDFDSEDESILVQLGQLTSAAIESLQLKLALEAHMQELEVRVAERTAELDTSNKELDAFAYSVAHDLRAPLRAMHGFADAVLEDYSKKLDEAGIDYLRRIVKGAKNMDALIADLLAYSRISREKVELERVSLSDTVQETLADLHAEIEASKAKLEVAVPPLTVLAHRATLRTVLLNLVSNALKFVAPGTAPRVRIWAVSRNGAVDLCVRDNGIGIAPEHQERIFNVFERLHGAEAYPGTGIGLSIVKKGLARMQGEVSIESGKEGSTFQIRLKEFRNG
ncbi:MAG: ATP-binding protein, partial [Bacillota bacterium]